MPRNRLLSLALATAARVGVRPTAAQPEVGEAAPDFELSASDGVLYTLEQYKGKQGVVLAWFPRAFTPG